MVYPYAHRHRKTEPECIAFKPIGPGDGQGVGGATSNAFSELATVSTYTVNPIYGAYRACLHAWHNNTTTDAIVLKVRPWVDHAQTIPGPALGMFELGSATIVTALTLPSGAKGGKIAEIIPGADGAGASPGTSIGEIGPVSHGFAVTLDINTNVGGAGSCDFELILQRTE